MLTVTTLLTHGQELKIYNDYFHFYTVQEIKTQSQTTNYLH